MSLFGVFDVSGSALAAESLRLNLTASNLANADDVSGDPQSVYRARSAVFRAASPSFSDTLAGAGAAPNAAVRVLGVLESQAAPIERYDPGHPQANERGMVYAPNVNPIEQMVDMISASRSYQSNLEVVNSAKELLLRTLALGQ